jgi:hypothetical protein
VRGLKVDRPSVHPRARLVSVWLLGFSVARFGWCASAAAQPDRYVVMLEHDATARTVTGSDVQRGAQVVARYDALNAYAARLSERALRAVAADERVAFVVRDRVVRALEPLPSHRRTPVSGPDPVAPGL